jgi:hypothetical protein
MKRRNLLPFILISLLAGFSAPNLSMTVNARTPKGALAPPASYDYSYVHNGTNFNYFKVVNSTTEQSHYTRSTDGAYYNYTNTTSFTGFPITLTFNRSNTAWTDDGGTYLPTDTTIGSDATVGNVIKENFTFNNTTSHDYGIYIDLSPTTEQYYQSTLDGVYQNNQFLVLSSSGLGYFIIPAYKTFSIKGSGSAAKYLTALYFKDLGISMAYTNGASSGYTSGYTIGDSHGYSSGYIVGNSAGYSSGYIVGNSEGYSSGYIIGNSLGYSSGYDDGSNQTGVVINDGFIVIAAIVAFCIGFFFAWKSDTKWLYAISGLLWFVPIFLVNNIFLTVFSIVMIVFSFILAFLGDRS